jgi:transcriptional antiterminator RfaH
MADTDLWKQINWYAIQTKPCHEDEAATNIRRLGLDVFLPKLKRKKNAWGRCKVVIKPLFPGYIFARFSPSPYLHSIRYTRGVTRVVSAGDAPLPLDNEIISVIQSRVGKDGFVSLSKDSLKAGDQVFINDGPLQGLAGIFEQELSDGERAVVLLRTVEYQARIFVEKWRLTAVTELH